MNGVHDMGGMTDFGPVRPEPNEPVSHAAWERRVLGMVRTIVDRRYNWDEFRFAIERIDPVTYLSAGYYERWLTALERFLVEKGDLEVEAMLTRLPGWRPAPGVEPVSARAAWAVPSADRTEPRFHSGDVVRARNVQPAGHTRLPRYVRGKTGTVERHLGAFDFPDSNSLGLGRHRQPCYAVRFEASDLWGELATKGDCVCVDLWESYLEPVHGDAGVGRNPESA